MKRIQTAVLGYPRIGNKRELKRATEKFWKHEIDETELIKIAQQIREQNWITLQQTGIDIIPSNDFSFYDQILDTTCLVGNIPPRFDINNQNISLTDYFAIARGDTHKKGAYAAEMTKWFDTNYHYIVPEFSSATQFSIRSQKPFQEYQEAKAFNIETRPVLIAPVTYLTLGKSINPNFDRFSLFDDLLKTYLEIIQQFVDLGVTTIQFDEPILMTDLTQDQKNLIQKTYETIAQQFPKLSITITSYFADLSLNEDFVTTLPVNTIHLDLINYKGELKQFCQKLSQQKNLSLGVINGRNIWRNNYTHSLKNIDKAIQSLGEDRLILSTSSSLLHVPLSLSSETQLDPEIKSWMSFAEEKIQELVDLAKLTDQKDGLLLEQNKTIFDQQATSHQRHHATVQERILNIQSNDYQRQSTFNNRIKAQQQTLNLPALPTTTIGSFPQTNQIRKARKQFKQQEITEAEYTSFIKQEIQDVISIQESLCLDVLVHGEPERNDMVEYFGEQLDGFLFTQNGWVQSYGSRCVKPPVIFGDVHRPYPMTVFWSQYAQSLTTKPMKAMLTGPVTIAQWSFIREDQPRSATVQQIALAIRDEVCDLEAAGLKVIQIDEPAIREGLPLQEKYKKKYLEWAVNAFRLATAGVDDQTQIHTHMCYSEFNNMIESVAALDADVISIESSRSQMELLHAFKEFDYPNHIGPGVYDIHSPRIPSAAEITELIHKALKVLPLENLWINPDCGLKTRGWPETKAALTNMVEATKNTRKALILK